MKNGGNGVEMHFSTKLFPAEAILGACHKFLAKCYVRVDYDESDARKIIVQLKPKDGETIDNLESEFRDEALDYSVKLKILKGTSRVRDQIFHIVFNPERISLASDNLQTELDTESRAEVFKLNDKMEKLLADIEEEEESFDYEDDPLGIATPWEEKYGQPDNILDPRQQIEDQAKKGLVIPTLNGEVVES